VLAVAASDVAGDSAYFSETGSFVAITAPGMHILSTYRLGQYAFDDGTSMAAPHVTGTIALMLQKNPALTQSQAESILQDTAIPLGAGCRDVIPVPGIEAQEICWGADATGAGLLDATAALAATP
jgi:subtilisin family serine protease